MRHQLSSEGLYLVIRQRGEKKLVFGFWNYRLGGELIAASGSRVGEDGVTHDNHFFRVDKNDPFYFSEGRYEN